MQIDVVIGLADEGGYAAGCPVGVAAGGIAGAAAGQVFAVGPAALGSAASYIVEGSSVVLQMYGGEIVGTDIPASVLLAVAETEPGLQGDRVSGARKPATTETGLVVQVPLFINAGDRIKVDTRSGEYISKA